MSEELVWNHLDLEDALEFMNSHLLDVNMNTLLSSWDKVYKDNKEYFLFEDKSNIDPDNQKNILKSLFVLGFCSFANGKLYKYENEMLFSIDKEWNFYLKCPTSKEDVITRKENVIITFVLNRPTMFGKLKGILSKLIQDYRMIKLLSAYNFSQDSKSIINVKLEDLQKELKEILCLNSSDDKIKNLINYSKKKNFLSFSHDLIDKISNLNVLKYSKDKK